MMLAAIVLPFIALVFFPAAVAWILTIFAAAFVPLMPLAIGITADVFYYSPHAYTFPLFTIAGLAISIAALLVRRFVETSIMR